MSPRHLLRAREDRRWLDRIRRCWPHIELELLWLAEARVPPHEQGGRR